MPRCKVGRRSTTLPGAMTRERGDHITPVSVLFARELLLRVEEVILKLCQLGRRRIRQNTVIDEDDGAVL